MKLYVPRLETRSPQSIFHRYRQGSRAEYPGASAARTQQRREPALVSGRPRRSIHRWKSGRHLSVGRKFGWILAATISAALVGGCGSGLVGPSTAVPSTAFPAPTNPSDPATANLSDPSTGDPSTGSPVTTLPPTAVCISSGLAAEDLSGRCRTMPTTMGALESSDGLIPAFAMAPTDPPTLRITRRSFKAARTSS
jgi:hypothetical protein